MMKQKKNKPRAALKTILATALCACSFFIFTEKIQAQTKPASNPESVRQKNVPPQVIQDSAKKKIYTTRGPLIVTFRKPGEPVELDWKPDKSGKITGKVHGKGVSQEKFDEYEKIVVNAYKQETIFDTLIGYRVDIKGLDIKYLRSIYESMTREQQSNATPIWGYIPKTLPPAKNPPTATQLEEWQNTVKYGVWIDGKKVNNKILANYKPADFAHTFVSYVYPNARKHGHIYQVDLATPAHFKKAWAEYDL